MLMKLLKGNGIPSEVTLSKTTCHTALICQKNGEVISSERQHATIKWDLEMPHPQLSNNYELLAKSVTNTLSPNGILYFSLQKKDTFTHLIE